MGTEDEESQHLIFSVLSESTMATAAVLKPATSPQLAGDEPVFAEERNGWGGYVEWEKYPDKKKQAAEILASHTFPEVSPSSFQMGGRSARD